MFFTKYPHRANFTFAEALRGTELALGEVRLQMEAQEFGGLLRVRMSGDRWKPTRRIVELDPPEAGSIGRFSVGADGGISIASQHGAALIESLPQAAFGISGQASIFQFKVPDCARYYGMGSKTYGRMELSGLRTLFWNTDVWSDFHFGQWVEHPSDPPYFSLPYLIVEAEGEYVGFLLNNPYPTFMETPGTEDTRVFVEWQRTADHLILGSLGGEPELWVLTGPSLRELTQKLQRLVGVTPLPPIWSLGYHQSRWGYGGHEDLLDLDRKFRAHQIPCDGLWLDLDYMEGFRVFTYSDEMWPQGVPAAARELAEAGRRIVPIIDPGVKRETGYAVFDHGASRGMFCLNAEGRPFVGMVWPGETVFPDFTLPEVREWWAGYASNFRRQGFGGAWIDMNDPATGPVDPTGMLFGRGQESHEEHHNQYALGMQVATREGFLRAVPNERPFLLSRSGFIGSSRYSAIWTGDNLSNRFYLKMAIPQSVNLSISGLPFNGPDIGGFGGDVTEELMLDWMKACFLFPFCRNHSVKDCREQEPWAFSGSGVGILRRYIRLRYKLLPYLYNLFVEQEEQGDPILRPLFYEFDEPEDIHTLDDEFMVGPCILQAPVLDADQRARDVVLPGVLPWMDANDGAWVRPGRHRVKPARGESPLYVRMGSIIPMLPGMRVDQSKDLTEVEFHVFVPEGWTGTTIIFYRADDGTTFDYQRGERSILSLEVAGENGNLEISALPIRSGFGEIRHKIVLYSRPKSVKLNGRKASIKPVQVELTGRALAAWQVS